MKAANGMLVATLAAVGCALAAGTASAQGSAGNGYLPQTSASIPYLYDRLEIPGLPLHTLGELESSQYHLQMLVNLQDQWAREAAVRQSSKVMADYAASQAAQRQALLNDIARAKQFGMNSPEAEGFRRDVFQALYTQQFSQGPMPYDPTSGFGFAGGDGWPVDPTQGMPTPARRKSPSKKARKAPSKPKMAARSQGDPPILMPKPKPKPKAVTPSDDPAPAR